MVNYFFFHTLPLGESCERLANKDHHLPQVGAAVKGQGRIGAEEAAHGATAMRKPSIILG